MKAIKGMLGMLFLTTAFGTTAYGAEPIVIKFSHVVSADAPKGKAALKFKEAAEQRTGGRVTVEVYPNSTLFKDGDEMRAVVDGSVQIIAPALSKFSPLGINEFEGFALPFIFPGKDVLRRITDGSIGEGLLKKLEPKGVVGLAYWDNGFKVMSANKPLRMPADFKGLKMRVQASKVLEAQMQALGAIPKPMAFSDVFKALADGAVDGTENPPSNLYTHKMHEVQKHVTVSNHGYLGYVVIVNKKFWDNLAPDIRIALKFAMLDATRTANQLADQSNNEAMAKIQASGKTEVYHLSTAERETWRTALSTVHKQMESRVGKGLIEAIYKEAKELGYKF